jgi:hypothetical protein
MSEYICKFKGTIKGLNEEKHFITETIKALDMNEARHELYKKYEHISNLVIVGEYQGWTNSKTWSAAYLVNQEVTAYKALTAIAKEKQVTGEDVKAEFNRLHLKCDSWTTGVINWQEIADAYYNIQ